jgi:hypothetical protein
MKVTLALLAAVSAFFGNAIATPVTSTRAVDANPFLGYELLVLLLVYITFQIPNGFSSSSYVSPYYKAEGMLIPGFQETIAHCVSCIFS